jgi:DNA-binding Lrp family transcriptional regulator
LYKELWTGQNRVMQTKSLTPDELKILWALQEKPAATVADLSKQTSFRAGKVQYALRRLKEDRGLIIRPFINVFASGAHYVAVYANLHAPGMRARTALLTFLRKERRVGWCGELIGDYEIAFTISCSHLCEIPKLFERMTEVTNVELGEYVLSPRIGFSFFKRKFLTRLPVKSDSLDAEYLPEPCALDQMDRRILKTLAEERFDSVREVARLLKEPISTIDRRVRELREKKVILGDFVDISPTQLQVNPYRLLIRTKGLYSGGKQRLYEFARNHPRVIFLIETLGLYDIEIGLELSSAEMIMEVISDFNEQFGSQIHTLRSLMETRVVKWSNYPG